MRREVGRDDDGSGGSDGRGDVFLVNIGRSSALAGPVGQIK